MLSDIAVEFLVAISVLRFKMLLPVSCDRLATGLMKRLRVEVASSTSRWLIPQLQADMSSASNVTVLRTTVRVLPANAIAFEKIISETLVGTSIASGVPTGSATQIGNWNGRAKRYKVPLQVRTKNAHPMWRCHNRSTGLTGISKRNPTQKRSIRKRRSTKPP